MKTISRTSRKAFTLLECVLAISISAIVMFGGAALLYDSFTLAQTLERGGGLKAHADGVEIFLKSALTCSNISDASVLGERLTSNSDKTIYIAKRPDSIGSSDWRIAYGVLEDRPLYQSPKRFTAEKVCWIDFADGILSIIWKCTKPENHDDTDTPIYRSIVSDKVLRFEYLYYDEVGGWEVEDKLREFASENLMPTYIKIVFGDENEQIERLINIEPFKADTEVVK